MHSSISASPPSKLRRTEWQIIAEARRAPHTPPRNATQTAESGTTAALSDISRARRSPPGSRLQLRAKRESSPTRLSPRWNHRAHRDTAIPLCQPLHRNRRARARSKRGKRAPLPTANHKARKRIGRTVGSKPETPCPDEKNMSLGPKAPQLRCILANNRPDAKLAADFCARRGRTAILFPTQPVRCLPHNSGQGYYPRSNRR